MSKRFVGDIQEHQPPIVEAQFCDSTGPLHTFVDESAILTTIRQYLMVGMRFPPWLEGHRPRLTRIFPSELLAVVLPLDLASVSARPKAGGPLRTTVVSPRVIPALIINRRKDYLERNLWPRASTLVALLLHRADHVFRAYPQEKHAAHARDRNTEATLLGA
jgi:hypothetical protein